MYTNLIDQKTIWKWDKELVDLHKKVLKTHLVEQGIRVNIRKKFFLLYNHYINEKNIRDYFFVPIDLLILGLVKNRLEEVKNTRRHSELTEKGTSHPKKKRKKCIN